MVDWSELPIELINIIVNYTDIVVYRYGKYINRINKNDQRYQILKKRHLPVWFGINKWTFYFRFYDDINKRILAMEHYYNSITRQHYLSKKELIKYDDGTIHCEKVTDYIVDLQGDYRQIIHYTM
jgi:hypothetical protein